jgi:SRSO17 transposase
MTARRPCPPAPGPLEDYATQFDPLLASVAQRRGLRDYLQGLLLPRDRNKTLTALADAEPITGAQHREVQRLQWFLSESSWTTRQSTSAAWSCCLVTRRPRRTPMACW